MKEITKDESKILKGIAILFMVGLHLFNRTDLAGYYSPVLYVGDNPLIYYVSFLFDACVPIYCFCSGYALFSFNNIVKKILLFFGNHSTNIWLVHMQFYMIFASKIVFSTNTVIGCFVILMVLCLISSYMINFIYSLCFRSM